MGRKPPDSLPDRGYEWGSRPLRGALNAQEVSKSGRVAPVGLQTAQGRRKRQIRRRGRPGQRASSAPRSPTSRVDHKIWCQRSAARYPWTRATALLLTALLVAVTVYLLLIPPGELKQAGCQCFGSRLRFQDVRTQIRFNGVLILLGVVGARAVRTSCLAPPPLR